MSLHYDKRLYKQDIAVSIAHAEMLAKQKIITASEAALIIDGLKLIHDDIESGSLVWNNDLEDIHMNIEANLFTKIGGIAGKLHTGRSRNDQIATDIRLYCKEVISETIRCIEKLQSSILSKATHTKNIIMPGYTHMQRAQPVLMAHHLMAYFHMFQRDKERFNNCYYTADVLPLGSGALAGVPYPIDRHYVADKLGFSRISDNSMDAVSDRDFLIDYHSSAATCMMHLSRFAEELILWSSQEFSFIKLSENHTTGSSIMPQKRNPDFAELARGRTGRVYGHLMSILTVLKGLPLTYNRDLQEDKEGFFDTVDTIIPTLSVFADMIDSLIVDEYRTEQAAMDGYILATDIADYLVNKGDSFRHAHGIVSQLVDIAISEGKNLNELSLNQYTNLSQLFSEDVLNLSPRQSIANRNVYGGTNQDMVSKSIEDGYRIMEKKIG